MTRSCDGCTKCCDGWLHGEAHGHKFYPGRKCHFVTSNGCSIYEKRPDVPCKSFRCVWLDDEAIPSWMKPSLSNVIITQRTYKDIKYLEVFETGQKMDSSALSWLVQYCLSNKINVKYQIDGGWNWIGSTEFSNALIEKGEM
jgi:hypothetical protein